MNARAGNGSVYARPVPAIAPPPENKKSGRRRSAYRRMWEGDARAYRPKRGTCEASVRSVWGASRMLGAAYW